VIRGERVPEGFVPRPNAMLDVTATELIEMANKMKLGEGAAEFPDLMLGAVATPRSPKPGWPAKKLVQKVEAGARFLLTHICMDTAILEKFVQHLVSLKITYKTSIIVSVPVLGSPQDARWLRENKPSVTIPGTIIERLAASADPRQEGISIAAEFLRNLARVPGLSGAHLYSASDLAAVPAVIAASELRNDPANLER
jgi:methylenetetrahydrofolate reductase (NADPH)